MKDVRWGIVFENMTPILKPIMWTLDEGLIVVRFLQSHARGFGYHLTLGGGVLNRGESRKDLDLYFLPLCNTPSPPNPKGLLSALSTLCGTPTPIGDGNAGDYSDDPLVTRVTLGALGRRIDIFIYSSREATHDR